MSKNLPSAPNMDTTVILVCYLVSSKVHAPSSTNWFHHRADSLAGQYNDLVTVDLLSKKARPSQGAVMAPQTPHLVLPHDSCCWGLTYSTILFTGRNWKVLTGRNIQTQHLWAVRTHLAGSRIWWQGLEGSTKNNCPGKVCQGSPTLPTAPDLRSAQGRIVLF